MNISADMSITFLDVAVCLSGTLSLINETQAEWIYVQPKMKICFKITHLQAIQDVDEFFSSSEPIWRKFKVKKKKKSLNLFYKQLFATQDVYW